LVGYLDFSMKIQKKEIEKIFSNDKMMVKEIEFLLYPKTLKRHKREEPIHGLSWKTNLNKLIKEGKLYTIKNNKNEN